MKSVSFFPGLANLEAGFFLVKDSGSYIWDSPWLKISAEAQFAVLFRAVSSGGARIGNCRGLEDKLIPPSGIMIASRVMIVGKKIICFSWIGDAYSGEMLFSRRHRGWFHRPSLCWISGNDRGLMVCLKCRKCYRKCFAFVFETEDVQLLRA